ncbi:NADPH--cytochrome P450 reductase-like isoform X2 [Sycon ciliatum]|uniref:NADPH--cytochrome P450 reductase-like isoform X2 n=1 Tax=Sycon ciliatum TaxID=27933 RepID=UPI0031F71DDE
MAENIDRDATVGSASESPLSLLLQLVLSPSKWDVVTILLVVVLYVAYRSAQKDQSTDAHLYANFIDKMKAKDQKVAIFYGSQTGTAGDFASRLLKDLRRMGISSTLLDPEDHDMKLLSNLKDIEDHLAIFVVATYGEGDPTDNARGLFDFLTEAETDEPIMEGLRFTVFSLGNKTYEHYNLMGRFVDKKMRELGGDLFFRRGEGDDDANIEDDFLAWREEFLDFMREKYNITAEHVGQLREYEQIVHDPAPAYSFIGEPHKLGSFRTQRPPFSNKNPYIGKITAHRELHTGGDRSCMHIELDIKDAKIKYSPGDHVAVQPVNNTRMVEQIGERLNIDLDTIVSLTATEDSCASKVNPFPCPSSYRTILSHYVDICALPRTNFLESMIEYCTEDSDKQELLRVTASGDAGRAAYNDFIRVSGRDVLDVLTALPSLMPPIDLVLEMLPRLQVRYYSISSSLRVCDNSIHITASTHDYITQTGRHGSGVTTSWLRSLQGKVGTDEARIPVYIRKSTLRPPLRCAIPIIMVGPGTGVAPFRAFIQDRHALKESGKMVGETRLYFGCRHKSEDFLYQEEMESYVEKDSLNLRVAYSRDQPEKIYVSDLLNEDGAEVWDLLNRQHAHFYVCGDAKAMAKDVHLMLLKIIQQHGERSLPDAEKFVKSLKQRGHYVVDAWS